MDNNFELTEFGRGHAYRLNNAQIKTALIDKLEKYYKITLFVPFGKTYKSATDKELTDIQRCAYLVNFNLSTKLSYLYLTEYNGIKSCYYIIGTNRSDVEVFSTIQRFSSELFVKDTLFEGYLLDGKDGKDRKDGKDGTEEVFLVEDLVVHNGHTTTKNLEDRIKMMNELLDYQYRSDPVLDNYQVILKDYVEYKYIRSFMTEYLQGLSYKSEVTGIIFSPLGNCVIHVVAGVHLEGEMGESDVLGETGERFETVVPTKKQACFLVKATDKPDVYHLYLRTPTGTAVKYYDIASIPDRKSSTYMNEVFKTKREAYMICNYDEREHICRWHPIMTSNRKAPDSILKLTI